MVRLFFLLVLFAPTLIAVEPQEQLKDKHLEQKARRLETLIKCPVCSGQTIAESQVPLARDLRRWVRSSLIKGLNEDQIKNQLVKRYGQDVLLEPRLDGHTAALWAVPIAAFLLCVGFLIYGFRRRQRSH